jgi:hypothetical protein
MAADANMMRRVVSSARGWPLWAMAPIFQITGNWASRSVLPINSSRPESYAPAMSASMTSFT